MSAAVSTSWGTVASYLKDRRRNSREIAPSGRNGWKCDAAARNQPGKEQLMNIAFIVDGAAVNAEGGVTFERRDPMTGKVATRAAAATLADVEKVAAAAAKAFETWSETRPSAPLALLFKADDWMEG